MSFLTEFLVWTQQYESPESYFRWAALSAVSTVIRDNLWNAWGNNDKLYCNMFILLVGPPALGKQLPMKKASSLVKAVANTKILEGSASIQAVIKTLGEYETGGSKGASGLILAEEYSAFHAADVQNTNDLLTTLWDFHEKWERNLISWNASLKRVCISLFAGSNDVLLREVLDSRALFGGLLSRTMVIVENRKRHKSALVRKNLVEGNTLEKDHLEEKLKAHLVNLSRCKGEIVFEEVALAEFEHWYHNQWEEDNPKTKTGVEGRMKTHVKKVAMSLAMCEWDLDQLVLKRHIEEAISLCTGLYKNYVVMASESGMNPSAHPAALLVRYLGTSAGYELARNTILGRHLGDFNEDILDAAAKQLEAAELAWIINEDGKISYRLTPKCLEMYSLVKKQKEVAL